VIAKVVFIAKSAEHVNEMIDKHAIDGGHWISQMDDGRLLVVGYPRHHATRFALAEEKGIVVIPGPHAPEPIGDLHKHLEHVGAQPHHTSRQVHLLLHDKHGPAFHSDT
jgi:hypothetical protein